MLMSDDTRGRKWASTIRHVCHTKTTLISNLVGRKCKKKLLPILPAMSLTLITLTYSL